MRKLWKKIVHAKWFPAALLLLLVCLGVSIYSGVTRQDSIVTRALNGILVPAQRVVTHTAVGVADTYNKYFRYDQMVAENQSLQQQVTDLTRQLQDAQAAVNENTSLREMLGVTERDATFTYAMAEVVGRTLDEWSSVLSIDAGSSDGLERNDCVVTAQGMVGYISDLSEHSAQVTTILDSNMSAGARIVRTGEIAVATGDYQLMTNGKLRINYLNREGDVVIGDTVQTSGSGGMFPKGLGIGTIESIQTESDGMSNYAIVQPLVDISSLTRVYIITDMTDDE